MKNVDISMGNDPISIIQFETNILFENIQNTFNSVSDEQMASTIFKWPLYYIGISEPIN